MPRSVPEWIGSTPDAKVPPRVRARIFERHGGKCYLSGRVIAAGEPWDLDHVVALANGGEHRETNLAPALKDKHREKTAKDVAEKAAVAATRKAHLGIKPVGKPLSNAAPRRTNRASTPLTKTMPPRRSLFVEETSDA